ncbi:MAG: methyltransferase domain-containing protein [candidate division Zixibacteria bacterium]|nr:methyltransferase domain-containing protein [candidate division Zixibacteria bacterium]
MPKSYSYAELLELSNPLREMVIKEVLSFVAFQPGTSGLDAGCGIGNHLKILCDTVGEDGHVTGLDISGDFLKIAKGKIEQYNINKQVTLKKGSIDNLPFEDNTFDWTWSADCAGYYDNNPERQIKELARVVKPGGTIVIMAWSSQQLLPGYPRLEARLNATKQGVLPFRTGQDPALHFFRAPGWFKKAGLFKTEGRSFIASFQAPLDDKIFKALETFFDMRWGSPKGELSENDFKLYRRLCLPDSPDFILNLPDYYAFFTYTLFKAVVPG